MVALLSDPARCQVALVTLPEEMPVNEVVEAAYQLEDKVGIALGPVIVNACLSGPAGPADPGRPRRWRPPGLTLEPDLVAALEAARRFRQRRHELQEAQVVRLAEELPLPQLRVPYLFTDAIGPRRARHPRRALAAGIEALHDPAAVRRA